MLVYKPFAFDAFQSPKELFRPDKRHQNLKKRSSGLVKRIFSRKKILSTYRKKIFYFEELFGSSRIVDPIKLTSIFAPRSPGGNYIIFVPRLGSILARPTVKNSIF